jgi:ribonuclease-3
VVDLVGARIAALDESPDHRDHKTHLQEVAARLFPTELPDYRVDSTGPDHAKHFRAVVSLGGVARGTGEGRSKKQAEQAAAATAIAALAGEAGAPALRTTSDDEGVGSTDA